jgi:thiamine biosynthesis lipoprotein
MRSAGSADHWSRREWVALGFLGMASVAMVGTRLFAPPIPEIAPTLFKGSAMGTTWMVKIREEIADYPKLEKVIAAQFEWAEQMTSHWRSNTDISAFNRARSTEPIAVAWPIVTLSRRAAEISRLTGGAYDITVGPLVRLWGFGPGPRRSEAPAENEIAQARMTVGWEKLEVLEGQLRKTHPEVEIDLSSIAKGWAIDQVVDLLQRRGFSEFLVEAGGELRVQGTWPIAIELTRQVCTLTNESIATSGTYRQHRQANGREVSHLIDPRTGYPINHATVSVSVRASDCAIADGWATALNVLGVETGLPLANQLNLAAEFVVKKEGDQLEIQRSQKWISASPVGTAPR